MSFLPWAGRVANAIDFKEINAQIIEAEKANKAGQYDKALRLNKRTRDIIRKEYGEDHLYYGGALISITWHPSEHTREIQRILPKVSSAASKQLRVSWGQKPNMLASQCLIWRRHTKSWAETRMRLLPMSEHWKLWTKPSTPELGRIRLFALQVALLHAEEGDPEKAVPFFERAMAVESRMAGIKDTDRAVTLQGFAAVLTEVGQHKRAVPLA